MKKLRTEGMTSGKETGMMFKVSVEGLPDIIMVGRSPGAIKAALRKIVKQPSMINDVERMPRSKVKKMYRDLGAGKEPEENVEESRRDQILKRVLKPLKDKEKLFPQKKEYPPHLQGDSIGKARAAFKHTKVNNEEVETIKTRVGERPKGPGWGLHRSGQQRKEPHDVWKRTTKKVVANNEELDRRNLKKVNEISKGKARDYISHASRDIYHLGQAQGSDPHQDYEKGPERKAAKRVGGINRATKILMRDKKKRLPDWGTPESTKKAKKQTPGEKN